MNEELYSDATIQLPEQASTLAPIVDSLFYDIFWISVAFFVAIVGAMAYFAWRFRRRPGVRSKAPGHHTVLELFWTFSPLILLAYMFHEGFTGFMTMSIVPENAINIRARARRWSWEFEQPNGMTELGTLTVPANRPVRMIMASVPNDATPEGGAVLHSFFVPAFRVKRDVVPGMFTSLWFEAVGRGVTDGHPRRYDLYCTEYCGTGHSRMLGEVQVLSASDYEGFLREGPACPPEFQEDWQWGERLFANGGCPSCHYTDPAQGVLNAPNLGTVAGTMQPLRGGAERMADRAYIEQSIREPQSEVVEGFPTPMPNQASMAERPLSALISYIAHLSREGQGEVQNLHCGDAAAAGGGEGEGQ